MTESPAWKCKEICEAANLHANGWGFFVGDLPADPDKAVMFKDVGGRAGEVNVAIDYPTMQVLVRGPSGGDSYAQAFDKARAIQRALIRIPSGGAEFPELTSITAIGHVVHVGKSERDRHVFSLNFQLIVSYTSDGYREALNS